MKVENKLNVCWFASGLVLGLTTLSIAFASVPKSGLRASDIQESPQLSEIRVTKEKEFSFDSEIQRLARLEHRYDERLPTLARHARVASPIKRIAAQKYQASSK